MPSSLELLDRGRATCAVSAGPSAAVGSSMIRMRALKWTARAIATDWRWPPDSEADRHDEVLELRVEPAHHLAGRVLHRAVVEVAEPRRQLASEEHVARRVDVVREREVLVDRLDAQRLRVARVARSSPARRRSGSGRSPPGARRTAFGSASVLPAPLPPTSPTTSPGIQVDRSRRRTAWTPPNATRMSRSSTSGVPVRSITCAALRRTIVSRVTARTSTIPTTMSWSGASMPISTMPDDERLHDERAEQRPDDRADAAGERRPADHRGGDHVELHPGPEAAHRRVEPGDLDRGRETARAGPSA